MKLGSFAVLSCAFAIGCVPPPPASVRSSDNVTFSFTNHTSQPICRIWRKYGVTTDWRETWAAKAPAGCLAPGKSVSLTTYAYDIGESVNDGQPRTYVASERLDLSTPPADAHGFAVSDKQPVTIVFEAHTWNELKDGTYEDGTKYDDGFDAPVTIEEFGRLVADKRQDEKRQQAAAQAAHAEKERQARAECFGVTIPKTPPARLEITGKWHCAGNGIHAVLRVLGDGGKISVNEQLFAGNGAPLEFDMNGEIHGRAAFAITGDGAEDDAFAQLQSMSGGLRLSQNTVVDDSCVKTTLLCTR